MAKTHHRWTKEGRLFKTFKPNQFIYESDIGGKNVDNGDGSFSPYVFDSQTNELKHGDSGVIGFESGQQVIKQAGKLLVNSSKFFVQQFNDQTQEWETVPHGIPTRNIAHDYPTEGKCTSYLNFPNAPYDLQIGFMVGGFDTAQLGFRFRAAKSGRVRFQWVNKGIAKRLVAGDFEWLWSSDKGGLRVNKKIGIRFGDIEFRWTYQESDERTLDIATDTDGTKIFTITFGEYDYVKNTWLEIFPDTFGPAQIAHTNDDCSEEDDTTVQLSGLDSDGCPVGSLGGSRYDYATKWDNVTPASGDTIDACTIDSYMSWHDGTGALGIYKGIEEANPANWSAGTRPSQRTKTTATVAWSLPSTDGQFHTSPELKTIIQEILDDTAHGSTDSLAVVLEDNSSPDANVVQFQDYGNNSAQAAKISITYTVAAAGGIEVLRRRIDGE